MYEDIRNKKIKTGVIISIFLVVITLIVYYVCMAFDLGVISIIIAMTFAIGTSWASYYFSDKIVLSINKAHEASPEQYKQLNNILEGLMVSSGLQHKPGLYVVDDPQPNAFATGRNPENAVICVTTGLLEKMDYYELEGVIAHELSHIKNYDIRLSAVVSVMVGFIVILADWVSRALFWGRSRDNDEKGNPILMLIGLICLILAPIFGQLMQLALSRRREYLADASAVELTRNPDGLISALQKLDADPNELKTANNSTAHMYIVSPFKANAQDGKRRKTSLFSTHPSIDDRIEAIRKLK